MEMFLLDVIPIQFRKGQKLYRYYLYNYWRSFRPHSLYPCIRLFEERYIICKVENFYKTNFPTDSDNNPCAYGDNEQFAFVYFPDVNDINTVTISFILESLCEFMPQSFRSLT